MTKPRVSIGKTQFYSSNVNKTSLTLATFTRPWVTDSVTYVAYVNARELQTDCA